MPLSSRPTYEFVASPELAERLAQADALREQLELYRPLPEKEHLWSSIQEKLRAEWTYHSNAIEGSTLTLGETIYFLQYGLTASGKPFKDFLDARNHASAIDLLHRFVSDDRELSEAFLKELNALLLLGVTATPAQDPFGNPTRKPATPGAYKKLPNSVLQPDGSIHEYVAPLHVVDEMEFLCRWVNERLGALHPIPLAAVAHYNLARIHPFDDGNGRCARILMNLILLKKRYPPAVIRVDQRRDYLESLAAADAGNLTRFITLTAEASIRTQQAMLEILENNGSPKKPGQHI